MPSDASEGAFDDRFLALCREYGLPMPELHVHLPAAGRLVEIDALWSHRASASSSTERVITRPDAPFRADRERDLALAAEGYVVVRLTWDRVTRDHARVAADLHQVLKARLEHRVGRAGA